MQGFVLRWIIASLGLAVASLLVPGMEIRSIGTLLGAALLLGLVNAFIRPIVILLTIPITIVTLGVFIVIINAAMLGLVASLLDGFVLSGFLAAVFGSIIVGITSWIAAMYIGPNGRVEILVIRRDD
ncbi:MAG: phage holin family protein [Gammaproteobacteria bacterium]